MKWFLVRGVMVLAVGALMLGSLKQANAVTISTLFNTGVASSSVSLSNGVLDTHYSLVSGPLTTGPVALTGVGTGFPIPPWVGDSPISAWIAPTDADNHPAGIYRYETTFDLTGLVPSTASITGQWATDNSGVMFINGINTGNVVGGFTTFTAFTISSGFQPGINTLAFEVTNFPQATFNPTGLRVELSGIATPVPEPSTWLLMGSGLVGLAFYGWRKRKQEAVASSTT